MAVEPVHIPKRVVETDPRQAPVSPDSANYWSKAAEIARHQREYIEEKKLQRDLTDPPPPPDSPIKISGGINLGNIDLQEQQKLAREESEKNRERYEATISRLQEDKEKNRDELMKLQMQHIVQVFSDQINGLKSALAGQSNNGGLESKIAEMEAIAERLGYAKPSPESPGVSDSRLSIELKRLEFEMQERDRNFQIEMKKDERNWQLEMEKLKMQQFEINEKLKMEREKWTMFASMPEQLGVGLAKGLAAQMETETMASGPMPQPQPVQKMARNVTANVGEAGEFNCPTCNSVIALGPETSRAQCASCRELFNIQRIQTGEEAIY